MWIDWTVGPSPNAGHSALRIIFVDRTTLLGRRTDCRRKIVSPTSIAHLVRSRNEAPRAFNDRLGLRRTRPWPPFQQAVIGMGREWPNSIAGTMTDCQTRVACC